MKKIIPSFCLLLCTAPGFTQWSAVGNGINGGVFNFLEWNAKLYMIGAHSFGTDTLCGIAAYDGANYSAPMPPGFLITSAAIYNNEFYAGGGFTNCGALPPGTDNIARWNGSGWSSVGGGGPGGTMLINAMTVYNGELYVGGNFTSIGGVSVNRIARWDGTQWKNVGGGVTGGVTSIYSMAVYKGELYVGGSFGSAGGIPAYDIARWNGTQWDSVGWGTDGVVQVLYTDTIDSLLYVGGGFYNAGGIFTGCFAKWNGNNWSSVGSLVFYGNMLAIARFNNKIYVGGNSSTASPTDTVVAIWDGNNWCPMVPGPDNTVTTMGVYQSKLYISGYFTHVDTISANYLVTWGGGPCTTAVNELPQNLEFKIFPNPANDKLNVESSQKSEIEILNIEGQTLKSISASDNTTIIDISAFARGMYFVKVKTEKGIAVKKFIKE